MPCQVLQRNHASAALDDYVRQGGSLVTRVVEGLVYVRQDNLRATLLGLVLVNSLFGMAYPTMLPVFARDILGIRQPESFQEA